jgi:hypothetical protein
MMNRAAQPARTPSSMRPRADALAGALVHHGMRHVPETAQLFRVGERIVAGGGGELIEVNIDRPPETWEARSIPAGLFARDPDDAQPLLVDDAGGIHRLEPDLSLREIHRVGPLAGGASVYALGDGRVLVTTSSLFTGTYLLDPAGKTRWRVRRTDHVLAAFEDVILAVGNGEPNLIVCRDMTTGDERWRRRDTRPGAATLVAVVDDAAWISDGTALVLVGLDDGRERALIDPRVISPALRLRPDARAHLVFGAIHHWLLDLRAGAVLSRHRFAASSSDAWPMEPLAGDAVLVRDRADTLYLLESGEGETGLPAPLWRAPAFPVSAVAHGGGLVVLTEPSGPRRIPAMRGLHWLAPKR